MSESYIGEIRAFAGNFAPEGWALCDGSLLAIASNTALFSLIGTTYGGDGQNTFALPDLRGRTVIHQGTGTGLSPYVIGEQVGTETVTLAAAAGLCATARCFPSNPAAHGHLPRDLRFR